VTPAEDELFGGAPGQGHHHPVEQLFLRLEMPLLFGQVQHVTERRAARDDRRLLGLVTDEMRDECVTALVVGEDALLLVGDDAALLQPGDHTLEGGS